MRWTRTEWRTVCAGQAVKRLVLQDSGVEGAWGASLASAQCMGQQDRPVSRLQDSASAGQGIQDTNVIFVLGDRWRSQEDVALSWLVITLSLA